MSGVSGIWAERRWTTRVVGSSSLTRVAVVAVVVVVFDVVFDIVIVGYSLLLVLM